MNKDMYYMNLVLNEAEKGRYQNWKKPLTAGLIVENDTVIAMDHLRSYGQDHTIKKLLNRLDDDVLAHSTLYTNIEPSDSTSKLIVKRHLDRVVIAQVDPRKETPGDCIDYLKDNGIKVTFGILEDEAIALNRFYNYFFKNHRPWITVKQSISFDNHVSPANGKYGTLTNNAVHEFIHQERADYQAVMVGSSTAIIDNPNLLTNTKSEHQPIRIVIDRRGRLMNHPGLNILNYDKCPTWIFTENIAMKNMKFNPHVKIFEMKTDSLKEVVNTLAKEGIQSLYVEGGPTLEKAFMDEVGINAIVNYISPVYLGDIGLDSAIPIHQFTLENVDIQKIDDNIRVAGDIQYN